MKNRLESKVSFKLKPSTIIWSLDDLLLIHTHKNQRLSEILIDGFEVWSLRLETNGPNEADNVILQWIEGIVGIVVKKLTNRNFSEVTSHKPLEK